MDPASTPRRAVARHGLPGTTAVGGADSRLKQQATRGNVLAARDARGMHGPCPSTKSRGRRECRVKASPMARLQKKNAGGRYHRCCRSTGIPCAMVLTLIRSLPGAPGCLATMIRAARQRRRERNTSIGVSGRCDFASARDPFVRTLSRACCEPSRPPHPRLACRDDRAQRPSR
jgi:hypothetical protein